MDLETVEMRGVNGEKIAGEVAMVKSMEIGGLSLRDFPVTFADNFAFEKLKLTKKPTLLLGMDAMKLFDRSALALGADRCCIGERPAVGYRRGYRIGIEHPECCRHDLSGNVTKQ